MSNQEKNHPPQEEDLCVFSWGDVPGSDKEQLVDHLVNDLKIGWAKNAEIKKPDNGRTITVKKDKNSLELKLNEEEDTVTLKTSGGETYYYTVEKENKKLNIYKEFKKELHPFHPILGDEKIYIGNTSVELRKRYEQKYETCSFVYLAIFFFILGFIITLFTIYPNYLEHKKLIWYIIPYAIAVLVYVLLMLICLACKRFSYSRDTTKYLMKQEGIRPPEK